MTWGVSPPTPGAGPALPAPSVPPAPPAPPAPPTLHARLALLPRQKAGLAGVHPKSCTSTFETFITRVLSKKHNRVNIACPKTITLNCTCMLFSIKRHISVLFIWLILMSSSQVFQHDFYSTFKVHSQNSETPAYSAVCIQELLNWPYIYIKIWWINIFTWELLTLVD